VTYGAFIDGHFQHHFANQLNFFLAKNILQIHVFAVKSATFTVTTAPEISAAFSFRLT